MAIAQSTDDLITFANAVYLEVNESPQNSTSNSLGTRVKTSIKDALIDLCTQSDWPWMQSFQVAESWLNEVATLPINTREIRFVIQERTNTSSRPVPFLPQQTFYQQDLVSFTGADGGIVRNYTQLGYRDVALNHYPADSASQAQIKFYVVTFVTLPSSDSSKFAIPDNYMPLLLLKTCSNFAISHLADNELATMFNTRYIDMVQRFRANIRNAPATGTNMFRNWRI
jgi:hypothetical protein